MFPSLTHSQFPVSPSVLACPPSSLPQPSLRASPFCPDQCWRAVHLLPQHGLLGGWRDSGFKSAQPQGGQSVELWSWLGFQAEQPWAAACAAVSGWRLLPDSPSRWCPWPSAYCGLAQGPRFTSATPLGEKKAIISRDRQRPLEAMGPGGWDSLDLCCREPGRGCALPLPLQLLS